MDIIRLIIKSRCSKCPTTNWVVTKITIVERGVTTIAHSWIPRGIYYCIETCGSNKMNKNNHFSYYGDIFGSATYEEMNQPKNFYFLHPHLHAIDMCNKQKQNA